MMDLRPLAMGLKRVLGNGIKRTMDDYIDELFLEYMRRTKDWDVVRGMRLVKRPDFNYRFELTGFRFYREGFGTRRSGVYKKMAEGAGGVREEV
jgi:hypothetical protein